MFDIASAVFLGNVLTLCVVWGASQFRAHDTDAPWIAYAAFILPILFMAFSIVITEGLPPQFDALVLR